MNARDDPNGHGARCARSSKRLSAGESVRDEGAGGLDGGLHKRHCAGNDAYEGQGHRNEAQFEPSADVTLEVLSLDLHGVVSFQILYWVRVDSVNCFSRGRLFVRISVPALTRSRTPAHV